MRALVDGVDHIFIPVADASAAFVVLTEELELPVLWPFASFGTFSSGGVSVGSIKLEVVGDEHNHAVLRCAEPAADSGDRLSSRQTG